MAFMVHNAAHSVSPQITSMFLCIIPTITGFRRGVSEIFFLSVDRYSVTDVSGILLGLLVHFRYARYVAPRHWELPSHAA
jgi:hypothetical protein